MWFKYIILNIKQIMQYKTDFLIGALPHLFSQVISIVFFRLILDVIPNIDGWTYHEMLLIYGQSVLVFGLYSLFFGNLRNMKYYLFSGEFDIMRLRPIRTIRHVAIMSFQSNSIEQIVIGMAVISIAFTDLQIQFKLYWVAAFIYFCICGTLLLGGLSIISSAILLFTKGTFTPLTAILSMSNFTKYPLSIFGDTIQILFTWIIPIGFVSFYPSLFFLEDNWSFLVLAGIISLSLYLLGNVLFNFALSRYEGVSA